MKRAPCTKTDIFNRDNNTLLLYFSHDSSRDYFGSIFACLAHLFILLQTVVNVVTCLPVESASVCVAVLYNLIL